MNDEIKAILDRLKDSVDYPIINVPTFDGSDEEPMDNCQCLTPSDCKLLLDYITNLQQINKNLTNSLNKKVVEGIKLQLENEKLKEQCKQWKDNHKAVCIQRDNILDNTVKDIEEQIDYKSRNKKAIEILELHKKIFDNSTLIPVLLDILQGVDKE